MLRIFFFRGYIFILPPRKYPHFPILALGGCIGSHSFLSYSISHIPTITRAFIPRKLPILLLFIVLSLRIAFEWIFSLAVVNYISQPQEWVVLMVVMAPYLSISCSGSRKGGSFSHEGEIRV